MEGGSLAKLDSHHLIIKCTIEHSSRCLDIYSLVDCGASGFAFIDKDYAQLNNLPLHSIKDPCRLLVIDSRPIDCGNTTHVAKVGVDINGHCHGTCLVDPGNTQGG